MGKKDKILHPDQRIKEFNDKEKKAREAFKSGQLTTALRLAFDLQRIQPNSISTLDLISQIYIKQGKLNDAIPILKRITKLIPRNAQAWSNLGSVQRNLNQPFYSKNSLEKSIEVDPDYLPAYIIYASLLMDNKEFVRAEKVLTSTLERKSNYYPSIRLLGELKLKKGSHNEAVDYYENALSLNENTQSKFELAAALFKQDHLKNAEKIERLLRSALCDEPFYDVAIDLLIRTLSIQNKEDEIEALFLRAQKASHFHAGLLLNFATFLAKKKRHNEANEIIEEIIRRERTSALPFFNGSGNLAQQGDAPAALNMLRRGITRKINRHWLFWLRQGNLLNQLGDHLEASSSYCTGFKTDPFNIYLWSNWWMLQDANNNKLQPCTEEYSMRLDYALMMSFRAVKHRFTHHNSLNTYSDGAPVRVGFVSSDLRDNVVGHFLRGVLHQLHKHYRDQVHLIVFDSSPNHDEITKEFQAYCSEWHSIRDFCDQSAATLIYKQKIEILIDLSGHTADNRMGIFSFRPAPIQVSWLGYFASTNILEMDYFISDPWCLPEESNQFFTENLWPLKHTRLCYTEPEIPIHINSLPAEDNGYVTFGSFNQSVKLTEEMLNAWAEILSRTPNSRLFIKNKTLISKAYQNRIIDYFSKYSISSNRLILEPESSHADYLECFSRVDIALDTYPYTGGATTIDNLRCGVPVISRYGPSLISRQGYGILMNVGLSDWAVSDVKQYIELAAFWAKNLPSLKKLRSTLRERTLASPLFDANLMAKELSKTFHEMRIRWQQGHRSTDEHRFLSALEKHYQLGMRSSPIWIICATLLDETAFWTESALGQSLNPLMEIDGRLVPKIYYTNHKGLPEVYNQAIQLAPKDSTLLFIHDDVWITHFSGLSRTIDAGLNQFDVIGVAGNRRRLPNQVAWGFTNQHLHPDAAENLSGGIGHGTTPANAAWSYFGASPAACELLDGVFLATTKAVLESSSVRFDPRFQFHFYDLDFCRSARKAKLTLGTWPLRLIHQSGGNYFSDAWLAASKVYLGKWKQ